MEYQDYKAQLEDALLAGDTEAATDERPAPTDREHDRWALRQIYGDDGLCD